MRKQTNQSTSQPVRNVLEPADNISHIARQRTAINNVIADIASVLLHISLYTPTPSERRRSCDP